LTSSAYISNARDDFLHKLSKTIIDENQVVVVEDINVKGLMQSKLAKSISDSSWSKFLTYLRYKAEWYGRTFIQVDRFFPSSKLCHCCGYKREDLALYERTWTCPEVKPGCGRRRVEHALVDDRIPYGMPKKPSCVEAGSGTFYKVE
jgi:IS605 OrfB family transposase